MGDIIKIEVIEDLSNTPFKDYTQKEWCLYFIKMYQDININNHIDVILYSIKRILDNTLLLYLLVISDNGYVDYDVGLSEF